MIHENLDSVQEWLYHTFLSFINGIMYMLLYAELFHNMWADVTTSQCLFYCLSIQSQHEAKMLLAEMAGDAVECKLIFTHKISFQNHSDL